MITVLASCDLERAAQTNWLNTACPICLSRNCVHTEKKIKKHAHPGTQTNQQQSDDYE